MSFLKTEKRRKKMPSNNQITSILNQFDQIVRSTLEKELETPIHGLTPVEIAGNQAIIDQITFNLLSLFATETYIKDELRAWDEDGVLDKMILSLLDNQSKKD
jgi:hypothetical protein